MTDANNPFAMMMAQAQEMAKALNPALSGASTQAMENLWPTMTKDMMEMSFGKGASKEGLDAQNETQIRMTVRHAVEAGATKDEVTESIAQMSMFAGLPAMTRAMEFANEVLQVSKEAQT
jgi:4-carboxymuconolactone decarboxylase